MGRPKKSPASTHDSVFDNLLAGIEKSHGKGLAFDMSKATIIEVPKFSYGSIAIDQAAGGGIPKGRIIEVYGPESSGKTTLCLGAIRTAQKDSGYSAEGRRALFIDAEHALDLQYAQKGIGVDTDNLILVQPDNGEQALNILEMSIKTGKISIAVVDSVAALIPKAELEGEMGDSHVALQARLMSQAMRKLTGLCRSTNTTLIFINQIRFKIGVMFGNPETQPGGNALKFAASQRIDIRRIGTVKDGEGVASASRTRVKFVKNKVAPPYRLAELDMVFGIGFDLAAEALDMAVDFDLIEKSGAWYSWPENNALTVNPDPKRPLRIGQGRGNVLAFLRAQPDVIETLRSQIVDRIRSDSLSETEEPDSEDTIQES